MKPMSKTPYEIRTELLQLAFGILKGKLDAEYETKIHHGESGTRKSSPSTEDVITEAEKLNKFVSNDHSH
jgi:hypothetical protein